MSAILKDLQKELKEDCIIYINVDIFPLDSLQILLYQEDIFDQIICLKKISDGEFAISEKDLKETVTDWVEENFDCIVSCVEDVSSRIQVSINNDYNQEVDLEKIMNQFFVNPELKEKVKYKVGKRIRSIITSYI